MCRRRPFEASSFARVRHEALRREPGNPKIPLASAEDVLLAKLEWYRRGGDTSERQWDDVKGLLRVEPGARLIPQGANPLDNSAAAAIISPESGLCPGAVPSRGAPTLPEKRSSVNQARRTGEAHPANPADPPLRWAVRPLIATALLTGLILRLAFGLGYWIDKPLTLDEQEYLLLAQSLVEGRGLTYPSPSVKPGGARHFERPPGYPVFLAGVMTLSGGFAGVRHDVGVPRPVKVLQSIVGVVAVLLIGLIARRAAGQRAGAIAVWIAAAYPPLVWSCAYVLAETLYTVLAFTVVRLLSDAFDQGRSNGWRVCAAGLVTGAALLTREAMVFFLVVSVLWLVAHRRWRLVAAFLAGALVIMLPWTMRNAVVHGGFVVGAPHGGVTFWTGNNELAQGEGDMAANPVLRRRSREIEAQNPGLSARELDALYYRTALAFITSRPFSWVWLEVRKVFYTIVPIGPSYRLHSPLYLGASVVSYLGVLPFAVAGFLRLVRHDRPPIALLLMALSAVLLSLVFFPQERFRIPVIDPALIVCAACWWGLRTAPAAVPGASPHA